MRSTASDPNIGQLLINRYLLAELIGKGSMGYVYRAEDLLLGKVPVAVKFLAQTLLSDRMKTRFAHEARTGAQLGQKSIHIVRVIDYGVNLAEVPFYVMEYLQGESLGDLIRRQPLPLPRFLALIRHVCLGLQCAHQGITVQGELGAIIHRDIKPSNILLVQDPGLGELAKILDFGIAKFMSEHIDSDQTQSFMGTPAYCSPEQMEGCELDSRSDIYSLGVMMFEMLTGKLPIQPVTNTIRSWYASHRTSIPHTLKAANPSLNLPQQVEDLVMGCIAKLPRDRPQSVSEILKILKPFEPHTGATSGATHQLPSTPSLQQQSTLAPSQNSSFSVEETCWQAIWPADKPIAEIVFPQLIRTSQAGAAALWVMMPQADIQKRLLSTRYNQFLCSMSPHPMVLWITAVYNQTSGPQWLPCYLDLKNSRSRELAGLLGETGYYPLLFFALEKSQQCTNVMTLVIAPDQCRLLRDWLQMSQTYKVTVSPAITKSLLKAEFERLKPKILHKLETTKQTLQK